MNINEFRITYSLPTYLCKVKRRNNIDQSYVYVDNFWEKCRCLILILVKKAEKRKANDEPTDPEKYKKYIFHIIFYVSLIKKEKKWVSIFIAKIIYHCQNIIW
jgi:hypothetical protein